MQYVDWLRRADSWPCGRGGLTAGELTTFPPKATAGNELFTDHIGDGDLSNPKNRLARHADIMLSNVKRVGLRGGISPIGRLTATSVGRDGHSVREWRPAALLRRREVRGD